MKFKTSYTKHRNSAAAQRKISAAKISTTGNNIVKKNIPQFIHHSK
jgi:hypothetical protein